jgi:serine/threonine-protein kinase
MTPERLGPYRIVSKLGRGGMGMVFLGMDDAAGQTAAVKLLAGEMAFHPDFRDRFKAEIETLRKLHHPNIVQIFGYGEQDDQIFFAMEYVSGSSLEAQLARGRAFDWREVAQFGIEIARGLRHAHDRGVIHRDIKPGNLLMTDEGSLKLSDFGIARLFWKNRVTGVGNVLGTAEFMAAEQAEGRAVDQRADLYSLGAVLYVLLARRPLYNARSFFEMLQKQREEKPAPLRSVAADVPVEFEQIIHRLLEKDPEKRFATATVVQRRLEAMLESLSLAPAAVNGPVTGPVTVDPAPVGLPTGAEPPPLNPLAVTVEATHFLDPTDRQNHVAAPAKPPEEAPAEPPEKPVAAEPESAPAVEEASLAEADSQPDESIPASATTTGRFVAVRPGELDHSLPERLETPWISPHTWALAIGLLVIGLMVWYMLQPMSADALYHRIERQTVDGSPDSVQQAEDDINQFLARFPGDDRVGFLNDDLDRLETWRLERDLGRQAGGMNVRKALTPVERCYIDALNAAKVDVDQGLEKFQALVDMFGPRMDISAAELRCIRIAKRRIEELAKQSEQQHKELLSAVNRSLDRADELAKEEPERAAKIRNAVIKLYAGKAWANEAVERARAGLKHP